MGILKIKLNICVVQVTYELSRTLNNKNRIKKSNTNKKIDKLLSLLQQTV